MAERPFMQFYGSDFVGDTLHLSAEQIGAYMLLLIAMWNAHGSLPNDDKKLARICRVSLHKWRHVWPEVSPFFALSDGAISHKRMKKERERLEGLSSKARENGSKGGAAKALKDKDAALAGATNPPQRKASIVRATPEPEPYEEGFSSENPKKPAALPSWFEEFWSMFPNKVGKADALKAFERASKRVEKSTMLAGLYLYANKSDDRPWCNPSTWLNQDRWTDQPAQVQRQTNTNRKSSSTSAIDELVDAMEQAENERHTQGQGNSKADAQHAIAGPLRRAN